MCEYCIEGTAIEIAKTLASGEKWVLEPPLSGLISLRCYLQECSELLPAILEYEDTLDEAFSNLPGSESKSKFTVVFAGSDIEVCLNDAIHQSESRFRFTAVSAVLQTTFCRIIEEIVKHGIESEVCHSLFSNSLVKRVIEHHSQNETAFDNRLFAPQSSLRQMLWQDVFFDKQFWKETINEPDFLQDCRNLVKAYVYWCHLGKNLKKEALLEESDILFSMYPHLFFGFVVATRHQTTSAYRDTLYKLLRINPSFTSFGMLLWLQRKAALRLHEALGLEAFLPYEAVRPALIYYLLVKDRLSAAEKEKLRDIVSHSEKLKWQENATQKAGEEFVRKMPVYARTESLIMECLA